MSYRMKTVERLTGLNRNTITTWERRYDLLEPDRDDSGYRVYSEHDVDRLRRVKELLDRGYAIRDAIEEVRRAEVGAPPTALEGLRESGIDPIRDALRDALLRFDRRAADRAHERLLGTSFRVRLEDVYTPLLREVGDLWAVGEITVAQEHFVSAFCREHLSTMLQHLEQGPSGGPVAVCAGLPGEPHEIALLAVAVQLALRGFRVVWLGADVPLEALVAAAHEVEAELVCHSLIQPHDREEIEAWVRSLREGLDPSTLIVIGGPGVHGHLTDVPGVAMCPAFDDFVDAWNQRASS